VRLADGRLARIAYAHEDDPTAATRLHRQAESFRHLQPAGRTPRLHEIIEPRPGLPGGALIVDYVEGRAPRLPDELDAMAETLAAIHSLPLPAEGSPIPRQNNPFLATLDGIELDATRFLDKAVTDPGSRAEIAEELALMRGMALQIGRRAQPLTMALADTHPGNFVVDRAGVAWFVDLEKVHVGSAVIDLAHATLPTSTLWASAEGRSLTSDEVRGFHAAYLDRIGEAPSEILEPWIVPMRRMTWLRTTLFMARWRVQTRSPRDPSDPSQWSDAGLEPSTRALYDRRIDQCFERAFIQAVRSAWL
jgi:aminoglycoside phosphotransferase (APT) family kinase protein